MKHGHKYWLCAAIGLLASVVGPSNAPGRDDDTTPPNLLSVAISPTSVDVTAQPDTVHVQFGASDDLAGIPSYFWVSLYSPSGSQSAGCGLSLSSGTNLDGIWEGDIVFPLFSEPGDWEFRFSLADNVGNSRFFQGPDLAALGLPYHVGVTSNPDTAPPTLLSLSIAPSTVDVTVQPDTVHVQIGASDNLAGIPSYFWVSLYSPSGNQSAGGGLSLSSGTNLDGLWAGDIAFPPYSEAGVWELRFSLGDILGNSHFYSGAELAALGFPFSVRAITYEIVTVSDVGNDQGRRARVSWGRHPQDAAGAGTPIVSYSLWRRIGPYLKSPVEPEPSALKTPAVYPPGDWDFVKSVPAHGEWSYNTICETLADSTISNGLVWTVFFVRAETASPMVFFDTQPDSGYSVDNLPPAPPAGLAGTYAAGSTHLEWNVSPEIDFWYYRLYSGPSAEFVPGPANLIATCRVSAWVDSGAGPSHYKLTAVDVNGNESPFTALNPGATSGVPDRAATFRLLPSQPNPFNPRTVIPFELPAAGAARLAVFDVAGRLVRILLEGNLPAGHREAAWDGRDAAGREVGSGTYLARLEAGGESAIIRMMLVR